MAKFRSQRRKKRRWYGHKKNENKETAGNLASENASTSSATNEGNVQSLPSTSHSETASAKKIKKIDEQDIPTGLGASVGFRFVDMEIMTEKFMKYAKCPTCSSSFAFEENYSKRKGFASSISVKCVTCDYTDDFYTSGISGLENDSADNPWEVNRRAIMAFREIGKGQAAMEHFCMIMNMPPPPVKSSYNNHIKVLSSVYSEEARKSLKDTAESIRASAGAKDKSSLVDCSVSVDGTWQKRGHASLNGVVTAIETDSGKVIDYEVLAKKCKGCEKWSKKDKESAPYLKWKAEHKCTNNYSGSAANMEPVGVQRIFHRSVPEHKLRYTSYIGDGDSKSFSQVKDSAPYGDVEIVKKECVGHVQKRVGSRLRKKKSEYGRQKLSDGKTIGGKGRLTNKAIDTLQNYYGMAVRGNKGNIEAMKKNIWASLYHVSSTDEKPQHSKCPQGPESWCKFQKDKALKTKTHKHRNGLPKCVQDIVESVYKDLTNDELLSRCADCHTQNANESFNGMVWNRIPKEVYVGANSLNLGVASAVIAFNEGYSGLVSVLQRQGMKPGVHSIAGMTKSDNQRLAASANKAKDSSKLRRKTLRAHRKGLLDLNEETEGLVYEAGNF